MSLEYRAIRSCFHNRQHYRAGDPFFATAQQVKDKSVPRHFVPLEKYSIEAVKAAQKADRTQRRVNIHPERAASL